MQGNKTRRRAGRDRCVLWARTGRVERVGTAGVDRVEALDLVAQIAYVRGGSAGRERGDGGSAREGLGGHGDEEVAKDLRGDAEVATARGDNRGRCVACRRGVAAAMADAEAARAECLVLSGSSGALGARGTCGAQRDTRRVSPGS